MALVIAVPAGERWEVQSGILARDDFAISIACDECTEDELF